jgi:hypothetical protein
MPEPIGSLAWAARSNGNLTARERRSFLGAILRTTALYTVGRARLALGLRRADAARLDLDSLVLPDSALAKAAEAEAHGSLTPTTVNHSYRTFAFGLALAQLDGVGIDVEHLYVASLMHDITLEEPVPGRCFAVRGGERARALCERAGADPATACAIADGVSMHITPGVGYQRGPLGPTVNAGALLDLLGMRLWDLDQTFVDAAIRRYPRLGCGRHLSSCWKAEVAAVPEGRAAAIERLSFFTVFVGLAPFAE